MSAKWRKQASQLRSTLGSTQSTVDMSQPNEKYTKLQIASVTDLFRSRSLRVLGWALVARSPAAQRLLKKASSRRWGRRRLIQCSFAWLALHPCASITWRLTSQLTGRSKRYNYSRLSPSNQHKHSTKWPTSAGAGSVWRLVRRWLLKTSCS